MDKAKRFNEGKPQYSLLHLKSLEPVVRVLEFGAAKYDRNNWKKPMDLKSIEDSLTRHLTAINNGELFDEESGELHMGHIGANVMFWLYQYNNQKNAEIQDNL